MLPPYPWLFFTILALAFGMSVCATMTFLHWTGRL
jgi:hypothetical protein